MRVLVTGATGNVGRAALHSVCKAGLQARAGVRAHDASLPPGVEQVVVDFTDPSTWDHALDGVDALFLLRPPQLSDMGPTLNAFVDRGADRLEHVVFLSVAGAEGNRFIPHAAVEAHLREGSVPYTFLRASFFGQNLCGPYRDDIRDDDRLFVPAGHQPVTWVDTRDLGEVAATCFADPTLRGRALHLTGAEARTFDEVAASLTEQLGRPIRYVPASILGYLYHQRVRRQNPWAAALVYTVLHTALRLGAEREVDPTLAEILGRPPRTIDDTIRDHLSLWMP